MVEHFVNDDNTHRAIMERKIHIQAHRTMVREHIIHRVACTADILITLMVQTTMALVRVSTEQICMVNMVVE